MGMTWNKSRQKHFRIAPIPTPVLTGSGSKGPLSRLRYHHPLGGSMISESRRKVYRRDHKGSFLAYYL